MIGNHKPDKVTRRVLKGIKLLIVSRYEPQNSLDNHATYIHLRFHLRPVSRRPLHPLIPRPNLGVLRK